MLIAITSAA